MPCLRCTALALALVGCGRLAFDDVGATPDAGTLAGAPLPWPSGPFGPPALVAELSLQDTEDNDPSLTADQLEVFFSSNRTRTFRVLSARRDTVTEPFRDLSLVNGLDDGSTYRTPKVSADGLTLWVSSDRAGGLGGQDVWRLVRATRNEPWSPPIQVPELSSPADDLVGTSTGDTISICSNRTGSAGFDLYFSTRNIEGTWGAPVRPAGIPTMADECNAHPSADLDTIYFDSDQAGGIGGSDIYVATRADATQPFALARLVDELSTPTDDEDVWISPDGRTIYLVQRTTDGQQDIYVATR